MKSNNTLLSIIIPNYNKAKYIQDCVESIQKQTFKKFEIIVVDDYSNDDSRKIITDLCSKYKNIVPIFNEKNYRVSKTRDIGFRASRGKYVTNIDSDDVYFNEKKLENELNLIYYYKDKYNIDIAAFSNIAIVDRNLNYIKDQWPLELIKQGSILAPIITRACHIPRDFIFSKEAYIKSGGYDSAINLYEDWDIKIRLATIMEYHYTGEYGIGYRQLETGLSSQDLSMHIKSLKIIFRKNLELVPQTQRRLVKEEFFEMINSKYRRPPLAGFRKYLNNLWQNI